ncbi:hypothetical protein D5047_16690 [Verminephrobacter eiseniae]|nr:hypothetical protein [Verminephrobacter eiseniae]
MINAMATRRREIVQLGGAVLAAVAASADMAQAGLNGFQEFMAAPERRKQIRERREAARKRVYTS